MTKHLLSLKDLSATEILQLVVRATQFKRNPPVFNSAKKPLSGQSLAMIFNKRSTRTRIAAECAYTKLGGHPIFLSPQDIQLGVNESMSDTAKVVSGMCDAILVRWGSHSELKTFAKHSKVPVINGLTDTYHPSQVLADLITIYEQFGIDKKLGKDVDVNSISPTVAKKAFEGLNTAWVGDANNMLNSFLVSFPRLGMKISAATPKGYEVPEEVLKELKQDSKHLVKLCHEPSEAIRDANIIITDTWISMGQEEEKQKRLKDFKGYQLTMDLIQKSKPRQDWIFMHCLPRKQEEVNDEVFYSDHSVVFEESSNRLYAFMAIFEALNNH